MELPINYDEASSQTRKEARLQYIELQNNLCMYCGTNIHEKPYNLKTKRKVDWDNFPPNFLQYPIHLQHNHNTGLTEGAIHSLCNAISWQYDENKDITKSMSIGSAISKLFGH